MIYLGIDMSSKKSGYSLFKDNKLIDFGQWEISSKEESDWRERIIFMCKNLDSYIKEHEIDKVFCEDVPPTMDNSQTVKVLSALQGCVMSVCQMNDIEIEFIPVTRWKNVVGIDMCHSKEYKAIQKQNKGDTRMTKFKSSVKATEKKLSIDLANHLFNVELVWKSNTSKYNQDDIADSINIVASQVCNGCMYDLETFESILNDLWDKSNTNAISRKR